MIADVKAFLEADAPLLALLGGDVNNTKIFMIRPDLSRGGAGETTPYIEINYSSIGSGDNVMEEAMISMNVAVESGYYETGRQITYRLDELLDVWEDLVIPSANFTIWYSRKVGGSDSVAEDTDRFNMARIFHFKYKRNTGG